MGVLPWELCLHHNHERVCCMMVYAQFARKENAMWFFLAAFVRTNVCMDNSHGMYMQASVSDI